jgi:sugar/nucleoside kinase (ribokinase family)
MAEARGEEIDVVCMGEALWDLAAPAGVPFARAKSLRLRAGGGAVNVALGLTRLGLRAALAAAVGDDALGRALRDRVAAGGVFVEMVAPVARRTGLVFVERGAKEVRFVGYRDRDEAVAELPPGLRARALCLTGLLPSAAQAKAWRKAASEARRRGAFILLDVNARPQLWADAGARGGPGAAVARRATRAALRSADVVKSSPGDLAALGLGEGRAATLAARREMRGSATLIVTRGSSPAQVLGPCGELSCPTRPLACADATGAGDAFCAGLLAGVLRRGAPSDQRSWEALVEAAHRVARRALARR